MNESKFTFKGKGDSLLNDVLHPDIFELNLYSYEFILKPKTQFWRFGIRFSRSDIDDVVRYTNKSVKHLEIAVGEYNGEKWSYPDRLFLQEYYFKKENEGDTITSWNNYPPLSEVYLTIKTAEPRSITATVIASGGPTFTTLLPIQDYEYFRIAGWADKLDFEFEVTVRILDSVKITSEQRIEQLWSTIRKNNLAQDRLLIPRTNDNSITVSIKDSFNNFYVNLQNNKEYYTVRRNPEPQDESYIIHDITTWKEVLQKFQLWIDDVKSEVGTDKPPNLNEARGVLLTEGSTKFQYRNDGIKPSLNVELQADIFFKIIKAISDAKNESGLLLGVFGKWGRGKTFFWKQLLKKIEDKNQVEFEHLEFHAWKYQDTPASWAYLYELFSDKFIKSNGESFGSFRLIFRTVRLNMMRIGPLKFYWSLFLFVFGIFWYFILSFKLKFDLLIDIFVTMGGTILAASLFYNSFSGLAKDFFKSYFSEISFKSLLGIQAEIQKELVTLLKTWIPKPGAKKIILFVDDIDRCDETRIIEVIDSLKIMIDNHEISNRVIVIAAIDEMVLKRAVKQKYFNSIKNDLSLSEEEKKKELEQLCREYLDKLFINGFKLSTLTNQEKIKLFNDLTDKQIFFRNDKNVRSDTGADRDDDQILSQQQDQIKNQTEPQNDYDNHIVLQPNDDFELMDYEVDGLQKAVRKYEEITPRSLRIFYYRYLLAREFMGYFIGEKGSGMYMEWHKNQNSKVLLPYLIVEYSKEKTHIDLLKEIKRQIDLPSDKATAICLGESFEISKNLYLALLRIVETVVPY